MKEFWTIIQSAFFAIGGWLGYLLATVEDLVPLGRRSDGMLCALVTFVAIDYITGVMCAVNDKELSSAVGFRGICRKILIFLLVGLAAILDEHILNQPGILRTAVIFFFLANEGLSILENAAHLGLKIPAALKEVLEQLHHRSEKSGDTQLCAPAGAMQASNPAQQGSWRVAVLQGTEDLPEVEAEPYTGAHEEKDQ